MEAPIEVARRVVALGSTAREQGRSLGAAAKDKIHELYDLKVRQYEDAGALARWDEIVAGATSLMERFTPHTLEELLGQAEGAEMDAHALLRLATEYEISMELRGDVSGGKCTGLLAHRLVHRPGVQVIGQNNDENPAVWAEGKLDIIVEHRSPAGTGRSNEGGPLDCVLYTHPGIPAYMGLNSKGLSVTWFYIDDSASERATTTGLPTCVLLRELLTFPSALAAATWLRSVPRAVPNAYMLADPVQSFEIECMPSRWAATAHPVPEDASLARPVSLTPGAELYGGFHANHFTIDLQNIGNDASDPYADELGGTGVRGEAMAKSVAAGVSASSLGLEEAKTALSTAPVHRENGSTLVSLVFEPETKSLYARFKGDAETEWIRCSLEQEEAATDVAENVATAAL
jgi:hypothetical protein